ncbi:hypothetical protein ACIP5Y_21170 [Nocardia sp. NPDC088792]|uniref:hypothetical protein n=1 Tax=Nocardia sp. NPDC088792 TaxID=3364332 RepID=UPI00380E1464
MSDYTTNDQMPEAWRDLLEGITILARHPDNDISPFHCEHDKLTVCANPADFTDEELERLDTLGFRVGDDEESFDSFRFGSA